MTTHIAVRDGLHACYSVTDTGRGRHYHGCEHATPKAAIAHSDALDIPAAPEPLAEVIGGERGHGAMTGPVALAAGPATHQAELGL